MGDLQGSIATVSALLPRVDALHRDLAAKHDIWILAASAPRRRADGRFVNAARLFSPDGSSAHQDKLLMTRFEREEWGIVGGDQLNVFVTPFGRLAVLICYDSEFPLLARAAVEAGAQVLLVPSCTETMRGYWRVRLGSQARAHRRAMLRGALPHGGRCRVVARDGSQPGGGGHLWSARPARGVCDARGWCAGDRRRIGGAMGLCRSRSGACCDIAGRWRGVEHARLGRTMGRGAFAAGDCRRFDLMACKGNTMIAMGSF